MSRVARKRRFASTREMVDFDEQSRAMHQQRADAMNVIRDNAIYAGQTASAALGPVTGTIVGIGLDALDRTIPRANDKYDAFDNSIDFYNPEELSLTERAELYPTNYHEIYRGTTPPESTRVVDDELNDALRKAYLRAVAKDGIFR